MVRAGDVAKSEFFAVTKDGDTIQSLGFDASIGTTGHYFSGSVAGAGTVTLTPLIDKAVYMLEISVSIAGLLTLFFPDTTANGIKFRRAANQSINIIFKNIVGSLKLTSTSAAFDYTLIRLI
jgi:hypothetical protein